MVVVELSPRWRRPLFVEVTILAAAAVVAIAVLFRLPKVVVVGGCNSRAFPNSMIANMTTTTATTKVAIPSTSTSVGDGDNMPNEDSGDRVPIYPGVPVNHDGRISVAPRRQDTSSSTETWLSRCRGYLCMW